MVEDSTSQLPSYYDRNPIFISKAYGAAGVAPAGATVRFTYTVPTGKKFIMGSSLVAVFRDAAAAPAARCNIMVRDATVGTAYAMAKFIDNTVGVEHKQSNGQGTTFAAAAVIEGNTTDASTGGTLDIDMGMTGIEFDA